jgi:hypothetical protein
LWTCAWASRCKAGPFVFRGSVLDSVLVAFFVLDLFASGTADATAGSWIDLNLFRGRAFSERIVRDYLFVVIYVRAGVGSTLSLGTFRLSARSSSIALAALGGRALSAVEVGIVGVGRIRIEGFKLPFRAARHEARRGVPAPEAVSLARLNVNGKSTARLTLWVADTQCKYSINNHKEARCIGDGDE